MDAAAPGPTELWSTLERKTAPSAYLVLNHGAEMVVPEEDAQLPFRDGGRELAQAVVGELGSRGLQELLCYQAWGWGVGGGGGSTVRDQA